LNLGNVLQINVPTAIPALQGADEEALGASHTCSMKNDRAGAVRCLGVLIEANYHTDNSPTPDFIAADSAGTYAVAAAGTRTCIAQRPGTVQAHIGSVNTTQHPMAGPSTLHPLRNCE